MYEIPFLRPNLVKKERLLSYFEKIEASRIYSNYGPLNHLFETRVIARMFGGIGAAVTVHNATLGLMLAISQSKRPRGKYAVMPSFTFAATPLAAEWCGLEPYFLDIEPDDWQMNRAQVAETVERLGDQIAVIVPYATFGSAIDLSIYDKLLQEGIPVVIDAAASFGTTVAEDAAQFGKGFGGAVVFSFHATKTFGVGEGGLVYSADQDLIQRIRRAGNFGFSSSRESVMLGLNSKISEYTAAIALATLEGFQAAQERRKTIIGYYRRELQQQDVMQRGWSVQKMQGRVPLQFFSMLSPDPPGNREVIRRLASHSIEARTYFSPACHQQKQFQIYPHSDLQVTERIADRIISLPLWEEMNEATVGRIVKVLGSITGGNAL
ncbi:aminotransferase class I/II-fold pyridoxal phosphate-dependent enzyme [Paenibacillus thiaminolyticus]|uniref:Aminotransferase class I/II-fold pyridoxal phosphate-dependent enzyme n=1 Tax=Paenibacillus thiaminolyticus TaxID=49283 RepID=A0AAP9DQX1_PANTH|nr:aminotransferase class I/II-fold pyridoxal phosphate-dependent enzyme [Paenibacillus thiaminolyticus]MCY9538282.1 aminotransferase class I/II-fold pyridoxal phosphate-dependent enzyme [Paenibacillus thiaminolyticus]MCY9604469.1 aminotransferase class I/II-fold pyridoxal phosphate-dependent enzyme [Paenibacillus thiaminolyticus]MCY9610910.1 aminotransferase class I/II-fold pyridoxal phosphate-dependent enzyme [Paenibacillus thiaminolyticus]MCY9616790.1 aminotransferase class I/II-fold pyridox